MLSIHWFQIDSTCTPYSEAEDEMRRKAPRKLDGASGDDGGKKRRKITGDGGGGGGAQDGGGKMGGDDDGKIEDTSLERYEYSAPERILAGSACGFVLTCSFGKEKSATHEVRAVQVDIRLTPH